MLLLLLLLMSAAAGVAMVWNPSILWLPWLVIACAGLGVLVLYASRPAPSKRSGPAETENIGQLPDHRRRELIRGTSMYLRELNYRYSIRVDPNETSEHRCFTAEVNSVKLGFVPVIIIDNTNDRQGYGYVAFVYDGNRWRGPGLPCPAGQVEAVRHAGKCVSPLAREEETRFEESTQF